ncbi:hypothetical protein FRC14_007866 [Serendipita sp. 396]|nr:hypothetical protein FRC14_007866 [Serendipita sp. 396]KAG8789068.1 hypothetical protein FRC15_000124 [Serendipita sp. 397]KAG8804233.1 hypothetical protein FRC16_011092 [Serendipita sp. 398]KAG8827635.1 hypothetical protein FRC19_001880 [Serendipita sp. 401]KAG8839648.1 hypothetical protein FRC18_009578 [Serendipita sp. 400]KAG8860999.1 hypothetical protein FRB91_011628 [Serendipita sp. 411]KAG8877010.1 hypothetical protein FRC20_000127 [Serendipita sp. 405]KAG9058033.1 hypothetical prot
MGAQDLLYIPVSAIREQLSFVTTDPLPWKEFALAASWTVNCFELYLLQRQYKYYSKTQPPEALKAYVSQEKFEKSQVYGKDKAKFSFFKTIYSQIWDSIFLYQGGFALCWKWSGHILASLGYGPDYQILQSIVFSMVFALVSSLSGLPLSIYSTFVLEERHGFNKTTPGLFVADMFKGWALGFALGAPFLWAFLKIFTWAGEHFVPWLIGFILGFQILMVFLYPLVIQPLFNKLTPLPAGELRERIEALATHLKFPLKHLYEIDGSKRSSHSNAYFFGLPWSKHIVVYDTLIKNAKVDGVEAVLAHELGHWFYYHPTKLMLISQLHILGVISCFPAFLHSTPLLLSFDFPASIAVHPPVIIAFMLYQTVLTPVDTFVSAAMHAVSRRFEYEADRFACELHTKHGVPGSEGMGKRLGEALISIMVDNLATLWTDPWFSAWHHTHPTLTERLKALEKYEKDVKLVSAKKEL